MSYPLTTNLPPVIDAEAPRYTSVAAVKAVLAIPDADTAKDQRITQAIIAAESTLDLHMNQALVDRSGTLNPELDALPAAWSETAKATSVGIYKSSEAPFGSAGSDDWLGTISVPQIVAETVRRNPLMLGWQVGFGVR